MWALLVHCGPDRRQQGQGAGVALEEVDSNDIESVVSGDHFVFVAIDDESDSDQEDDQPIELALVNLNAHLEEAQEELDAYVYVNDD